MISGEIYKKVKNVKSKGPRSPNKLCFLKDSQNEKEKDEFDNSVTLDADLIMTNFTVNEQKLKK
jgi:hypothetical protein